MSRLNHSQWLGFRDLYKNYTKNLGIYVTDNLVLELYIKRHKIIEILRQYISLYDNPVEDFFAQEDLSKIEKDNFTFPQRLNKVFDQLEYDTRKHRKYNKLSVLLNIDALLQTANNAFNSDNLIDSILKIENTENNLYADDPNSQIQYSFKKFLEVYSVDDCNNGKLNTMRDLQHKYFMSGSTYINRNYKLINLIKSHLTAYKYSKVQFLDYEIITPWPNVKHTMLFLFRFFYDYFSRYEDPKFYITRIPNFKSNILLYIFPYLSHNIIKLLEEDCYFCQTLFNKLVTITSYNKDLMYYEFFHFNAQLISMNKIKSYEKIQNYEFTESKVASYYYNNIIKTNTSIMQLAYNNFKRLVKKYNYSLEDYDAKGFREIIENSPPIDIKFFPHKLYYINYIDPSNTKLNIKRTDDHIYTLVDKLFKHFHSHYDEIEQIDLYNYIPVMNDESNKYYNKHEIIVNTVNQMVDNLMNSKNYIERHYKNQIHPDTYHTIHLILQYLKFKNLNIDHIILKNYIANILLLSHFNLLNLIRQAAKITTECYAISMKQSGYIQLYGMDTVFGYRLDSVKEMEISKQLKKSLYSTQYEYGQAQASFFSEHFKKACEYEMNNSSLNETIKNNSNKEISANIYPNKRSLFNADGNTVYHVKCNKKRKFKMNKTQFFSTLKDYELYFDQNTYDDDNNNNIIIKREPIKQRIVFNTNINTYIPLTKMTKILEHYLKGFLGAYCYETRQNKIDFYARLLKYTSYNKFKHNRYLLLPLDYSSFDTTITWQLIDETLKKLASRIPDFNARNEYIKNLIDFEQKIPKQTITYISNKQEKLTEQYKYGMLSGWKITNPIESLLNYIVSYGVISDLGYTLIDLCTMGDDLIFVLDLPNLSPQSQLQVLSKISDSYKKLGFILHPIKNLVTYNALEFLRNYYSGYIVQSYPMRNCISLYFRKPTSELEFVNFSNIINNINAFIFRNNLMNKREQVMKLYLNINTNDNIRAHGFAYTLNPDQYIIDSKNIEVYTTTMTIDEIKNTSIFTYYRNLMPQIDEKIIITRLAKEVFSKNVAMETIKQRNKPLVMDIRAQHVLSKVISRFTSNMPWPANNKYTFIARDYLLIELLLDCINKKGSLAYCQDLVVQTLHRFDQYNHIALEKMNDYNFFFKTRSKEQLRLLLKEPKIPIIYQYCCNNVAAIVKNEILNYYKSVLIENIFRVQVNRNVINEIFKVTFGRLYNDLTYTYFNRNREISIPIVVLTN